MNTNHGWAVLLVSLLLCFAGCGKRERISLVPNSGDVALGARIDVLGVDGCTNNHEMRGTGGGKIPTSLAFFPLPSCAKTTIATILSKEWDDPSVFVLEEAGVNEGAARFVSKSLKEGSAQLTVVLESGTGREHQATGDFTVRTPNRVELATSACLPELPLLLPSDSTVELEYKLRRDTSELSGYDYYPFTLGSLSLVSGDAKKLTLKTPREAQAVTITSPIDPAFAYPVQVVTLAEVDGLELWVRRPAISERDSTFLGGVTTIKGRKVCQASFTCSLTIETPAICSFRDAKEKTQIGIGDKVDLMGLTPGTCRVTGKLDGSALSTTLEVKILESLLWEKQTLPRSCEPSGLWGSSASDVYVVGRAKRQGDGPASQVGAIFHYDGTSWSEIPVSSTAGLGAVWGSSASDVFAVGGSGTILHFDGSAWTTMPSGTTAGLPSVWGSGPTNVYAAGTITEHSDAGVSARGVILHYDGSAWSEMPLVGGWHPTVVWVAPSGEAFVGGSNGASASAGGISVVLKLEGGEWKPVFQEPGAMMAGLWGSSASDLFAVGHKQGVVVHFDGTSWTESSLLDNHYLLDKHYPTAVFGLGPTSVFVTSGGSMLYAYDGSSWQADSTVDSGGNAVRAIWGTSRTGLFAITMSSVYRSK